MATLVPATVGYRILYTKLDSPDNIYLVDMVGLGAGSWFPKIQITAANLDEVMDEIRKVPGVDRVWYTFRIT